MKLYDTQLYQYNEAINSLASVVMAVVGQLSANLTVEEILFHAIIPGLDEELLFRGLL